MMQRIDVASINMRNSELCYVNELFLTAQNIHFHCTWILGIL